MIAELVLGVAITLLVYAFYKWIVPTGEYFQRRGLKYAQPTSLLGDVIKILLNKSTQAELANNVYNEFPEEPIYGRFSLGQPIYILRDPDVIKKIGVKDFDHFEDHRQFLKEDFDGLWGNCLLLLKGKKWRDMRATLSPAFTGSKMRQMFELVSECAENYVKHFSNEAASGKKVNIETKDTFSRYLIDVIASCVFGLQVNSVADPKNEFFTNGSKLASFTGFIPFLKIVIINLLPRLAKALDLQFLDARVSKMFKSIILDTMEMRKTKNIQRPDMINILMQVREGSLKQLPDEASNETNDGFATVEESEVGKSSVARKWTDDELIAQCFIFFLAGFDSSSTALAFTSYELISNPDIQQKLYAEIAETNERIGGKRVTYDVVQKMKYLDQVVCEVLRKWPAQAQIDRECVKDYVYDDGDKMKFTIERGRQLFIAVYGVHHDPKFFSDPERFDPERFSEENKKNITPGSYMPFGIGPRSCIASRFALTSFKIILYYLLLNFSFEANEKTDIPIKLFKNPFHLRPDPEKGVHLELRPRKKESV